MLTIMELTEEEYSENVDVCHRVDDVFFSAEVESDETTLIAATFIHFQDRTPCLDLSNYCQFASIDSDINKTRHPVSFYVYLHASN